MKIERFLLAVLIGWFALDFFVISPRDFGSSEPVVVEAPDPAEEAEELLATLIASAEQASLTPVDQDAAPADALATPKSRLAEVLGEILADDPAPVIMALKAYNEAIEAARNAPLSPALASALMDGAGTHVYGPADATVVFTKFNDPSCGFCKKSYAEIRAALEKHPDVRFQMVEIDILGPVSRAINSISFALYLQDQDRGPSSTMHADFYGKVMTDQGRSSEEAALTFAEEVGADMRRLDRDRQGPVVAGMLDEARDLAQRFNVSGTPTFIINGLVQNGYVPADRLDSLIRQAKGAVAKADSDS